ncbi:D-alanyl-lipoteichoic acid biosynthesis protein DltD [Viridibacillus sp. YIM B01967]|uniref:Protein DltD n=1 Tax=Viridibacillus soli TaxID=2798301 RepID=A0ABS1HCW1_9BACL|nr:D-alanyl-lipoteichoic acid biosynthesis protein DltD [Viridibacillus soli]MBK3496917.1 D-alanyl-lipoteichoic acid biosynthesis protein DltD [Viridibacillus soli]
MKKYAFLPLIIAVILFLVFLFIPNKWLVFLVSDKDVEDAKTALNPLMFQGEYMQNRLLQEPNMLPIYGSSELNRFDPFHPYNYFKANDAGFTTYLYGRGGTQSIHHFLNFAAQEKNLKDKKLVFIISPQWFTKTGVDEFHFSPNYSMLQSYDLALNDELDPELKKKAMERLLEFETVKRDFILSTIYENEVTGGEKYPIKAALAKPVAFFNKKLMEKKDLYYSVMGTPREKLHANPEMVEGKSFEQLTKHADEYGSERVTTNDLSINDRYFKKKIEFKLKELKEFRKDESYTDSPEYEDFQMVLEILKDAGAKPMFVSIPVNGKWYDYAGFPQERREEYYAKINKQVQGAGFPLVDFTAYEYEPHFISDTIHISWKGWVYLDHEMANYWKLQ